MAWEGGIGVFGVAQFFVRCFDELRWCGVFLYFPCGIFLLIVAVLLYSEPSNVSTPFSTYFALALTTVICFSRLRNIKPSFHVCNVNVVSVVELIFTFLTSIAEQPLPWNNPLRALSVLLPVDYRMFVKILSNLYSIVRLQSCGNCQTIDKWLSIIDRRIILWVMSQA